MPYQQQKPKLTEGLKTSVTNAFEQIWFKRREEAAVKIKQGKSELLELEDDIDALIASAAGGDSGDESPTME